MLRYDARFRYEYEVRMHKVLAHIDQHLDKPLDLGVIAKVANFSPYHFHRVFAAWMGETLGDYLRRRRIEMAARLLSAQPRTKVLNIALSVGFGSAEAFSRAFKTHFGCTPGQWRTRHGETGKKSNSGQTDSNRNQAISLPAQDNSVFTQKRRETKMEVTLVERQPVHIAYHRHFGPYGEAIARFWSETYAPWAIMNRLGPEHPRYGITYDDPSITPAAQCRYDACAEVDIDFAVNGGALKATIPGGQYAHFRFRGTQKQESDAWFALFRDWLPASGLQLDNRPCFEFFPKGAWRDTKTGEFECEICIPVIAL